MQQPDLIAHEPPKALMGPDGRIAGYSVVTSAVTAGRPPIIEVGFCRLDQAGPTDGRQAAGDHTLHPNAHLEAKQRAAGDGDRRCRRRLNGYPNV